MTGHTKNHSGEPGYNVPAVCLVTGGSGFVGQRLVEMLVERGAKKVISFDIAPTPKDCLSTRAVEYVQGDIMDNELLNRLCSGVDCVFHIAALVGPYHAKDMYKKVNYDGTINLLNACKANDVKKIVMSSSPSTRFPYPDPDISDKTEDDLFKINGGDFAPVFMQPYAETKAMGEKAIRDACGSQAGDLLTIAVAPHQVYGPRDGLFLPNLLEAAGTGKLRIFGSGLNRISFCHADNYCHGLILGAEALYPGSPALGKYYVVTDGPGVVFWKVLDEAIINMGFTSLWSKMHLPTALMMVVAYLVVMFGSIWSLLTGTPEHVVNYKLKLNPFAVKMLVINRHFNISAAERDLKYKPVISFTDGWAQTITWFRENWLPKFNATH
jgi:nucleoside-diphosphate-sugar epimerase